MSSRGPSALAQHLPRSCCGRDCLVGLGLRLTDTMSGYVDMLSRVCVQAMMAFAVRRAHDGVHHTTEVLAEPVRRGREVASPIDRSHGVPHKPDQGPARGCETISTRV